MMSPPRLTIRIHHLRGRRHKFDIDARVPLARNGRGDAGKGDLLDDARSVAGNLAEEHFIRIRIPDRSLVEPHRCPGPVDQCQRRVRADDVEKSGVVDVEGLLEEGLVRGSRREEDLLTGAQVSASSSSNDDQPSEDVNGITTVKGLSQPQQQPFCPKLTVLEFATLGGGAGLSTLKVRWSITWARAGSPPVVWATAPPIGYPSNRLLVV